MAGAYLDHCCETVSCGTRNDRRYRTDRCIRYVTRTSSLPRSLSRHDRLMLSCTDLPFTRSHALTRIDGQEWRPPSCERRQEGDSCMLTAGSLVASKRLLKPFESWAGRWTFLHNAIRSVSRGRRHTCRVTVAFHHGIGMSERACVRNETWSGCTSHYEGV